MTCPRSRRGVLRHPKTPDSHARQSATSSFQHPGPAPRLGSGATAAGPLWGQTEATGKTRGLLASPAPARAPAALWAAGRAPPPELLLSAGPHHQPLGPPASRAATRNRTSPAHRKWLRAGARLPHACACAWSLPPAARACEWRWKRICCRARRRDRVGRGGSFPPARLPRQPAADLRQRLYGTKPFFCCF